MTATQPQTPPRSTLKTKTRKFAPKVKPPLMAGDRLTRAEFERRYADHPEIKKAELVEGVVYVSSPVRQPQHSRPHAYVTTWAGCFVAATPSVDLGDNATVRLDFENEYQPDILLRLEPEDGGKSFINEDGYIEGAPELVAEIAASSASFDLHDKRRVYAQNGVQEYIAFQMYERQVSWFMLIEGVYELIKPGEDGIIHSGIFPGLWLNPATFWERNLAGMLETVQAGVTSAEHATLLSRLGPT